MWDSVPQSNNSPAHPAWGLSPMNGQRKVFLNTQNNIYCVNDKICWGVFYFSTVSLVALYEEIVLVVYNLQSLKYFIISEGIG